MVFTHMVRWRCSIDVFGNRAEAIMKFDVTKGTKEERLVIALDRALDVKATQSALGHSVE